ncbi:MAG: hypothetical protein A2133_04335 [Actinobacteria bacterium RBG_16_64_13]|nr:MAG: hypothetical protein A2133_04335 [Actinobacteria bacterium RBG_16_64_13]
MSVRRAFVAVRAAGVAAGALGGAAGRGNGAAGALRVVAALCLLAAAAFVVATSGSCASEEAGGPVLSIDQALASESGQIVRVQGHLVATEAQVVLASALLESYPPQAGDSTLRVEGLDLVALVGLSSTADQPDLAQVTWSDYPVVLEGVVKAGILSVKTTPMVVEAGTPEVRVRFTPVIETLGDGQTIWWVLDVTNLAAAPADLTFADGQMGEVVLSQAGTEKYRWSAGKAFVESSMVMTLQPGRQTAIVLNDAVDLVPGAYEVTAVVKATMMLAGAGSVLPEIKTTLTVR